MKKFAIILLAVTLIASMAMAEKPKEAIPSHATYVGSDITLQGGEDISTATVIPGLPYTDSGTTVGYAHDYTFTSETAGDVVYVYTPAVDVLVDILLCDSGYDTKLGVILDPPTLVAYNDDNSAICGPGFRSALIGIRLNAGVDYYIVVTGFGADEGDYVLDMDGIPAPQPPANDLCEDAEVIPVGAFSIDGNTTTATDNYTTDPDDASCTDWAADGNDLAYAICLSDGDIFDVAMSTTDGYDASIYLVLDCADIFGTCVAGSDVFPTGEAFSYQNVSGENQQLYLIVDAFASGAGDFNITGTNGGNCEPVATDETNWGSLKGMYR